MTDFLSITIVCLHPTLISIKLSEQNFTQRGSIC